MMTSSPRILGALCLGLFVACSSSSTSTGASSTTSTTSSGHSSSSHGSSSGSTSGSTHSGGTGTTTTAAACAPTAACAAVDKACLGLVDNSGKTKFGLRLSDLEITKPAALTTGILKSTVGGGVVESLPSCNLEGSGTFSWLLEFDTTANTLEMGGALPATDPTAGYSFVTQTVVDGSAAPSIVPLTAPSPLSASGTFSVTETSTLVMPIYLDAMGTNDILLPLQSLVLQGTLSTSHDCVGTYNAAGLDPMNSCLPDATHPQFLDSGSSTSFIALADADTVAVPELQESLCVLLSGDSTTYGMTSTTDPSLTVCKRDAGGNILFQGDWCAATNAAATPSCADASQFAFTYAASSVLIND